jgi:hypothetical protein
MQAALRRSKTDSIKVQLYDHPIGFPRGKLIPEKLHHHKIDQAQGTLFLNTAMSPCIAVNPRNPEQLIAVWCQDVFSNGGALYLGMAASTDSGKTWRLQTIAHTYSRIIRVSLAYHETIVLIAAVFKAPKSWGLAVYESRDHGMTWEMKMFLETSSTRWSFDQMEAMCIAVNSLLLQRDSYHLIWPHDKVVQIRSSFNGKDWSQPRRIYDPQLDLMGSSNQINHKIRFPRLLVLPASQESWSQEWLCLMIRDYATPESTPKEYEKDTFPFRHRVQDLVLIRSSDKGETWSSTATIIHRVSPNCRIYTGGYDYTPAGSVQGGLGDLLMNREPVITVNPQTGFLYVVWTGTTRADLLPEVLVSMSHDGGWNWSRPRTINHSSDNLSNPIAYHLSMAISPSGYLGILYVDCRWDDRMDLHQTNVDVWLAIFQDPPEGSELVLVREVRMTRETHLAQNGPLTEWGYLAAEGHVIAQLGQFYVTYTETMHGPFIPADRVIQQGKTQLYVDRNYRTIPCVTVIGETGQSS